MGDIQEKIFITGTGRCGTTFLIKLFTFLEFDTGFTKRNYQTYIAANCNSGMEKPTNSPHHVIKNPLVINEINTIVQNPKIKIQAMIIPIRDLKTAANSRAKHANKNGGLWNAHDERSQLVFYEHILANYIEKMTKHDIPTIFLDFGRMVEDPLYLYEKLFPLIQHKCTQESFCAIYEEVSQTSRP
jgi:hypothetical protein